HHQHANGRSDKPRNAHDRLADEAIRRLAGPGGAGEAKVKRKRKKFDIIASLARRRDPIDRLYAAVARYVKAKGGSVVVIGGIQCEELGGYRYAIKVQCTGRKPDYAGGQSGSR